MDARRARRKNSPVNCIVEGLPGGKDVTGLRRDKRRQQDWILRLRPRERSGQQSRHQQAANGSLENSFGNRQFSSLEVSKANSQPEFLSGNVEAKRQGRINRNRPQ